MSQEGQGIVKLGSLMNQKDKGMAKLKPQVEVSPMKDEVGCQSHKDDLYMG